MWWTVLGSIGASADGRAIDLGGAKQRRVLAALLIEPGSVVPVSRLVDAVWGSGAPSTAIGTVRAYLANLRRALEPGRPPRAAGTILVTSRLGYRLQVGPDELDATRFRALVGSAIRARNAGRPRDALRDLAEVLGLWQGPPFGEFSEEPFAAAAAVELNELFLTAQEEQAAAQLAVGQADLAATGLRVLATAEPLRECRWEMLALALYRTGRQAEALAVLRRARHTLVTDLGIEPGTALRRLEQAILRQDAALDLAGVVPEATPAEGRAEPGELVGRADVLHAVGQAFAGVGAGRGRLFLVTGEPGIGKTRVTESATEMAAAAGFTVALGRCPDGEGVSAFWPWLSVLRGLITSDPPLAELAGRAGLGVLLDRGTADRPPADRSPDRAGLHTAIAEVLAAAARRRPLLVVLDDLHWADPDSVLVLRVLTTMLPELPLLLVAASRDGADLDGPAARLVAQLTGHWAARWPLRRLTELEVSLVLAGSSESAAHPDAARVIHQRSGGNPFYVVELARLLPTLGAGSLADALPHGARDLIRHRLSRLPSQAGPVLVAAAVIGEEFRASVLAQASGLSAAGLSEILDAALRWGLVTEGRSADRYRFGHALVRDTLRSSVSRLRLAQWHASVADALSQRLPPGAENHDEILDAVAFHWLAAAAVGHADAAIEAGQAAAERAERMHAYERAATLLTEVVDVIDQHAVPHTRDQLRRLAELLVRLGRASCRAGLQRQASAALARAIGLARQLDDPRELARAATTYSTESFWLMREYRATDDTVLAALRDSVARLPVADSALRCLSLAALAAEDYFVAGPDVAAPDPPSATAVAIARRLADPELLMRALHLRHQAIRHADTLAERQTLVAELVELAAHPGVSSDWTPRVLLRRALTWLEAGDMAAAQRDIDACARANRHTRLPEVDIHLRWWTAMRAGLGGDPRTAVRLSRQAYELHRQTVWGSASALAAQLGTWLLDQGEYHEVETLVQSHDEPGSPVTAEHVGLVLALQGRSAEARTYCPPAAGLAEPPRDWLWLTQMVLRAYTWALCGDVPSSEYALDRLLPYAGRSVTTGSAILCWGSIDHFLGESAATVGRTELAVDLLRGSVRHNADMGCVTWQRRSADRLAALVQHV